MVAPRAGMHVVMVFHVLSKGNSLATYKIKQSERTELMEKWFAEEIAL